MQIWIQHLKIGSPPSPQPGIGNLDFRQIWLNSKQLENTTNPSSRTWKIWQCETSGEILGWTKTIDIFIQHVVSKWISDSLVWKAVLVPYLYYRFWLHNNITIDLAFSWHFVISDEKSIQVIIYFDHSYVESIFKFKKSFKIYFSIQKIQK